MHYDDAVWELNVNLIVRANATLPSEVDIVVLGSGVAGLTAALTGALQGRRVLLLEHLDVLGGTSARSSGTVWIPANRAMLAAGHSDEGAALYLSALVGQRGSEAMWRAFLEAAPLMQADLEDRANIVLRPFPSAPDYRQDLPGAALGWRAMEPQSFDGRRLGRTFRYLASPLREMTLFDGMMVTRSEASLLLRADQDVSAAKLALRLTSRYFADRIAWPRGTRLVLGNALVARLLHQALAAGVIVRRSVETKAISMENGEAAAVLVRAGGRELRINARLAIILAGGGFPANPELLASELPKPTPRYTPASPGATGKTIELALSVGAILGPSGLDNSLWFPSSIAVRQDGSTAVWPHIVLDRAKPGSLIVDQKGMRFANEAISYHEFGRAMYQSPDAIPCWMICDRNFIHRYGIGLIRPRTISLSRFIKSGYLFRGETCTELAVQIGVPPKALNETVERFSAMAVAGVDVDFHRGETPYERANGDTTHLPNPCLGPLLGGSLYAVRLEPTPLGTSRGLQVDHEARVLRANGKAIKRLYACGNDMQSVFGGEYPGAGAQLGQAMTFAWLAVTSLRSLSSS